MPARAQRIGIMFFQQIVEPKLSQYSYLIGCEQTKDAIIVDPQRDIDRYLEIAAAHNLRITAAAETHIHADYLTGLREFAILSRGRRARTR